MIYHLSNKNVGSIASLEQSCQQKKLIFPFNLKITSWRGRSHKMGSVWVKTNSSPRERGFTRTNLPKKSISRTPYLRGWRFGSRRGWPARGCPPGNVLWKRRLRWPHAEALAAREGGWLLPVHLQLWSLLRRRFGWDFREANHLCRRATNSHVFPLQTTLYTRCDSSEDLREVCRHQCDTCK